MRAMRPSGHDELDKPFRAERCPADAEPAQSRPGAYPLPPPVGER